MALVKLHVVRVSDRYNLQASLVETVIDVL